MLKIDNFLKNIKLDERTKDSLNNVWYEIELYLNRLQSYSEDAQKIFLKDYLIKENINSSKLECELYSKEIIELYEDNFFATRNISDNKLKIINKSIRTNDKILDFEEYEKIRKERQKDITYEQYLESEKYNLLGNYRKEIIWIGGKEGIEYAHHIPPRPEELEEYVKDFVDYYNNDNISELSDPIVKAALVHAIFIKIHPFSNGNGRTARILLNGSLRFGINEKYGLNLKYPPINLSKSFDLSRMSYFNKQNDIIFKEDVDNTKQINAWIRYNIIAIEEQLFYLNSRLDKYDKFLQTVTNRFEKK